MAKIDKEYEARMQGMIYACNLAEKEGLEALKNDIKMRGITKAPLNASQKEIAGLVETLSENLYTLNKNKCTKLVINHLIFCIKYGKINTVIV